MNYKFRAVIIALFGFILGCNQSVVSDFSNPDIEEFYRNYSIESENVKKFIFDGVLVAPYFIPRSNYESHDLAISAFSRDSGRKINIGRIVINGIGTIHNSEVSIDTRELYEGLFRYDVIMVTNISTSDILKASETNEVISINIEVAREGKKNTLEYQFFVKNKFIAAPIR